MPGILEIRKLPSSSGFYVTLSDSSWREITLDLFYTWKTLQLTVCRVSAFLLPLAQNPHCFSITDVSVLIKVLLTTMNPNLTTKLLLHVRVSRYFNQEERKAYHFSRLWLSHCMLPAGTTCIAGLHFYCPWYRIPTVTMMNPNLKFNLKV